MINDYSTLKQAVADWLARADLTAQIPTFIDLAEARINRDLRMRQMQTTVTGTLASHLVTLPSDFREVQSLRIAQGNTYGEIKPLPPQYLAETIATGYPLGYVMVNGNIQTIGGTGSESYAMTYWAAVPALSDSATQNWLILREPGVYLYGTLIEASPYLGDDARTAIWAAQYAGAVEGMRAEDASSRYGNAPTMTVGLCNAP